MNTTTVTVVGNLTRDPEIRFTPNGTPVATTSVAVNRRRRTDNGGWEDAGTEFYGVTIWRDLAEHACESLPKGTAVIVTGRLQHRTWETEAGERRSAVEIVADAIGPDLRWQTVTVHRARRDGPPHPADTAPEPAGAPAHQDDDEPF